MNLQLRQYWELLRSSYWFLPTLMCLSACGAAILLVYVDYLILRERERVPDWIYQGSPEGARTVLSTIGGSMIRIGYDRDFAEAQAAAQHQQVVRRREPVAECRPVIVPAARQHGGQAGGAPGHWAADPAPVFERWLCCERM